MEYPIIGIDLGTCFSCVYGFRNGQFILVPGDSGNTIPSVIQYGANGPIFGTAAKNSIRKNGRNTIYDVKRFLGLPYEQCRPIIEHEQYGFRCISYHQSLVYEICVNEEHVFKTPELVDADFLEYLVKRAESFLEYKVEGAVITIPAFFQYGQTNATLRAAEAAGLKVYGIVYEPSAAAIAITPIPGVNERHILVFDMGGGTFDVALIRAAVHEYTIIGNGGHPFLGGRDFDQAVVELILNAIKSYCDTTTWRANQWARLTTYAEQVKIDLSQEKVVELDLDDFDVEISDPIFITRKQFEEKIRHYIQDAIAICDMTLQNANVRLTGYDSILLVGGSSKIPLVREELRKKYGDILETNNNPDEDVAKGACMVALDKYCANHDPPFPNPCTPTLLHTFVMRAVGISFGHDSIQVILPVGTPCNEERELISNNFIIAMTITLYCMDAPNSNAGTNANWRKLTTFTVKGLTGKAYIRLALNEMGRLRYTVGRVGNEPTDVNTIEIANEQPNTIMTFNARWIALKNGIDKLKTEKVYVNQSNTPVKNQLLTNLDKAIAYLGSEKALLVDVNTIKQYVAENQKMVSQYVPHLSSVC